MLEKLSTENLNYIIGFLQGDGHHGENTRNRGKIHIKLSEKDIDILDKLEKSETLLLRNGMKKKMKLLLIQYTHWRKK